MAAWEGCVGESDEWYTPPEVFAALGCSFDVDVSAPADRRHVATPATDFITEGSLEKGWRGFVWMNPPFGRRNAIAPWLDKFFAHGNGVALTPDRPSAPWFWAAWSLADAVLFTRRIRFVRPDGSRGKAPPGGAALWATGPAGVAALERAEATRFGILAKPCGQSYVGDLA